MLEYTKNLATDDDDNDDYYCKLFISKINYFIEVYWVFIAIFYAVTFALFVFWGKRK